MTGLKLDMTERMRRAERNRRLMWGVLLLAIGLPIIYGFWWVGKRVNYSLQYEDMVRATVREMVQPEALKERP